MLRSATVVVSATVMKRALFIFTFTFTLVACGGSNQHTHVQEVPIDQAGGGGGHGGTELPPDEVGNAGGAATSTIVFSDASAPPGVGPQSLDVTTSADAGPAVVAASFTQRPGGLSQRECTDVIMKLATLMSKDNNTPAPATADLAQHPIFGQMITECGKSTTKKQQKCANASKTTAAWKKCME